MTPDFTAAGFFVFRTPLLPIDEWTRWSEGLSTPVALARGVDADALAAAIAEDRAALWERLRAVMIRPEVRQALFFAAPGVEAAVEHLEFARESDREPDEKLRRTLVRYFARMTGRATPFGLFAGCSLGRLGSQTSLRMAPLDRYQTFTTLDVGLLYGVTERVKSEDPADPHLRVWTNPTLYRVGTRLRFIEVQTDQATLVRNYRLSAVASTNLIEAVLDRAAEGASLGDLIGFLQESGREIREAEARAFVDDLVECQLLVSELEPGVIGSEPLADVIARLGQVRTPVAIHARTVLSDTGQALRSLDQEGVRTAPSRYRDLLPALRTIMPTADPGRCFQANLYKPAPEAVLDGRTIDAVKAAVETLHRITPYPGIEPLNRFREAFRDRYGGCEVPLLEALDEDVGVGYDQDGPPDETDSPWLSELAPPVTGASGGSAWTRRDEHLLKRVVETVAAGEHVLQLGEADLEVLRAGSRPPLPPSFAASVTLAAETESALEAGRFELLLHGIVGPSGAEFLGRFCHGNQDLCAAVGDWLAQEEESGTDAILAEVVHLPQGRDGNIICRPRFRQHEIHCLGQSDAAGEYRIPVSDLVVRLVGDRVVLRSRKLGREIQPRLAASHYAPVADLALYRFLWALQRQDATALTWQWGPLAASPFLPRVSVGGVVLCRASWRLDGSDLAALRAAAKDRGNGLAKAVAAVGELRRKRRIPRHVGLLQRDKALLFDLDNVLCVDVLASEALRFETMTLIEQFPSPDRLCAIGPEGRFVHEVLLPFRAVTKAVSRQEISGAGSRTPMAAEKAVERVFPPGGEWFYAKIYGSPRSLDSLLTGAAMPVIRELRSAGLVDGWFFIRYWDPRPHLRVRLHGRPDRLRNEAWPRLEEALRPWLGTGEVWTVQVDTYVREIERYGGPEAIEAAERFFAADSDMAASLIGMDTGRLDDVRERFAVASVAALLNDVGFDLQTRESWTRNVRDALLADLGLGRDAAIGFGRRFRSIKGELEELIGPCGDASCGDASCGDLHAILRQRSPAAAEFAAKLRALERDGRLTASLPGVVASLAHMSVNRLVPSAPRTVEVVVFDFLNRLYAGAMARSALG
jgi:lantibiotic biosynthesis protein